MSDSIIRKIAVIFVTDVVGFSKMMEANEDKTLQSFRACMDIMETLFGEHGGRVFNTAGDSVLAEFQSAVSAVVCASEFQKLLEQRNSSIDEESPDTVSNDWRGFRILGKSAGDDHPSHLDLDPSDHLLTELLGTDATPPGPQRRPQSSSLDRPTIIPAEHVNGVRRREGANDHEIDRDQLLYALSM